VLAAARATRGGFCRAPAPHQTQEGRMSAKVLIFGKDA
jgi:hypothetical protein